MKCVLCGILIFLLSGSLSAQFVAKLPMPKVTAGVKDSIPDPVISEYNKLIKEFNTKKSDSSRQAITDFLKKNTLDKTNSLYTIGDSLLSKVLTLKDTALRAQARLDTLVPKKIPGQVVKNDGTCPNLYRIADIKIEKNDNAEYVVSLIDSGDNPLKSFVLKQFNPKLYEDKVKRSLYGLCDYAASKSDSDVVDALWAEMNKQDLYARMLEASLEVNDADIPAGELRITKNPPLNIWIDSLSSLFQKSNPFYTFLNKEPFSKPVNDMNALASSLYKSAHLFYVNRSDNSNFSVLNDQFFYVAKDSFTLRKVSGFTVYEIAIQFQDGFIENIKVLGKWNNNPNLLKFENFFPIPFSTRRDFKRLQNYFIYERTIFSMDKKIGNYKGPCSIRLGDLLFYSQNLSLDTKDYSPYNHVYNNNSITDSVTVVNMYKEKTSKILELKVFTDLKGLENDNPNGLVQLELSKKLNFYTIRFPFPKWKNLVNIGALNFVTPYFTMNKIENNNKRLIPSYFGTQQKDTTQPNVYASTINLLQYQVFGLGVNVNAITIDIPGLKSTLCLNTGFYFGRTLLEDTMRVKADSSHFTAAPGNNLKAYGVNTFQIVPEIAWQIFPDKRYGVCLAQRFNHFRVYTNQLTQVRDSADYTDYLRSLKGDRSKIENYSTKKWIGISEVFAFYRPSEYNQVFFRYRFNWDLGNAKDNFHQIQLGISTYLTHTKKTGTAKENND